MAISDTITSMYTNVGEVYDTITNVTLPEHKNIENIPSTIRDSYLEIMNNGIDVIWDNWEKVVGEGTELTLSNTEQAPMKVLLKGNTYQDSTTGKNLLNLVGTYTEHGVTSTGTNDGKLVCSGTCDATYFTISNRNIAQTLPAGTYTFSIDKALSFGVVLRCIYASSTPQANKKITAGNTSVTFTIDEPVAYLRVYAEGNISSGTNINATFYPMLESGNTATSFEPYTNGASPNPDYPQDVEVVTGDNTIKVEGKNLLNSNGTSETISGITFTNNGDGTFTANGTATANRSFQLTTDTIILENNTTYTQSVITISGTQNGSIVPSFKNSSGTISYNYFSNNQTKTTTDIMTLNRYDYYLANGTTVNNWTFKVQLEKSSTATSYEPYQSQSYAVNLGTLELCKIGDYQDYIYKEGKKWYKYKAIGKVVLNGSETGWEESATNVYRIASVYPSNVALRTEPPFAYSNYYKYAYYSANITTLIQNGEMSWNGSKYPIFRNDSCANLSAFKTWLSTHNTIVYYVLANPTTEEITDTTLISQLEALKEAESYSGQTNISQTNNDLPFVLDVSALKEI